MLGAVLRVASLAASWLSALWVHSFDGMGNDPTSGGDPFAFAVFVSLWVGSWWLVWRVGM